MLTPSLGPKECILLSMDDKANVKIGVVAANKQTAMCMHMEYQVRLPNHGFIVAPKHSLTPSVYAFLQIIPNRIGQQNAVTYKGPTVVRVRSGKHATANSESHRLDLTEILSSKTPLLKKFTCNDRGTKRILLLRADNGPDEAPCNPSTQRSMIQLFL